VLNACYSNFHADAISQTIDFTVTMQDKIGDQSAVLFASAFYLGLAEGRSVEVAFRLGVSAIKMEGYDDGQAPALLIKPGADATKAFLSATPPEATTVSKAETKTRKAAPPRIGKSHHGTVDVSGDVRIRAGKNVTIAGLIDQRQKPHRRSNS
jgi:hypothetical protein